MSLGKYLPFTVAYPSLFSPLHQSDSAVEVFLASTPFVCVTELPGGVRPLKVFEQLY